LHSIATAAFVAQRISAPAKAILFAMPASIVKRALNRLIRAR
jgi:hypothetical protein